MSTKPIQFDFTLPESLDDIAKYVVATKQLIETVVNEPDQSSLYTEHRIPKKNDRKEFRVVWEIEDSDLKAAHKSFQRRFEDFATNTTDYPTDFSHGYVRKKSTFTNASVHAKKRLILHADIKNFFPTITSNRIQQMFLAFGMNNIPAETLAKFLTINGVLALGLPASPLLANLICLDLDKKFADLALRHGAKFTRYADDITFSNDNDLPAEIEITSILAEEGFTLAAEKLHVSKMGQSHFVTGLSVSDARPRIPRKLKRRIRQELKFASKFGLANHLNWIKEESLQIGINRIDGTLKYFNAVEPELAVKLEQIWRDVLLKSNMEPGFKSRKEIGPWELKIFFGTAQISTEAGKVLAVGCVTTENEEKLNLKTDETIRTFSIDPLKAGYDRELKSKGLSFDAVDEKVRTEYIDILQYLPFRGFATYDFLEEKTISYEEKYLHLLSLVLPKRLMAADQANVTIVLEDDNKVPFENIEKLITKLYSSLEEKSYQRPAKAPKIINGRKNEYPGLSVVDFTLNVIVTYAVLKKSDDKEPKAGDIKVEIRNRFERLRDKIRFIESKITTEIFTQNNPFLPWNEGSPKNPTKTTSQKNISLSNITSKTHDFVKDIIQDSPRTLVMKGGGVKGLAYVGAIRELEKYYNFDRFAGTSAGAIAASLLAIGYTTDELENELRNKNFKNFLDAGWFRAIYNLIFKGGFFEARAFTFWLDQLFGRKIKSICPLTLKEFPKRLTVYASKRNKKALIFDSIDPSTQKKSASFAVRCSMSIPFVFTPQRDEGFRVFDGGMQNNYPIEELLNENQAVKFIGLYLGNYYEGMERETSILSDLFHIFSESHDVDALGRHQKDTIIIDPRPVSTIDFDISIEEKDFLVKAGKIAALRFIAEQKLDNGPSEQELANAEKELTLSKLEIIPIRNDRKSKLRKKCIVFGFISLIILFSILAVIWFFFI